MGPLSGIRIIELAGLGPGPFAAMLLGDLGADVIRIDRPGGTGLFGLDRVNCRSRRSLGLNLKDPAAVSILLDLVETSDVLIEGMRPGVAERLGVGPADCTERNPRLVFARMTGWGQEGPMRDRSGHDINFIALSGALDAIGNAGGKPVLPLTLVGDFGGGAMFLVMGVLAAIIEREQSGRGQVIDAAMVDAAASLMTMFYEFKSMGYWGGGRGENLLDGGAPFYDTYETSDRGWMAVGALEPRFFAELVDRMQLDFAVEDQYRTEEWPRLRRKLEAAFLSRTRDDWTARFADSDACAWPVLSMDEAPTHQFNIGRGLFTDVGGVAQAAPAPRFSRSRHSPPTQAPLPGEHTNAILSELGYEDAAVGRLYDDGSVFST